MFDVCIPWDVFGCISITMWICTNILYTNINGHQKIKSFAVVETLTDIATVQCRAQSRDSVWAAVPERIWVQLKMGTPKIAKFIGILMMKHWIFGDILEMLDPTVQQTLLSRLMILQITDHEGNITCLDRKPDGSQQGGHARAYQFCPWQFCRPKDVPSGKLT